MRNFYTENEYFEFWIKDGIVYNIYKPSLKTMTIDIAKRIVRTRLKIVDGTTYPVFIDTREALSINKEARDYFAEKDAMKYINATAILVNSQTAKLLANFYITLSRPKGCTKIFTNKDKALNWLQQFKSNNS